MTVGEFELEGVAADGSPTGDTNAGEVFVLLVSGDVVAQKVALALGLGAGGEGAKAIHCVEGLGVVLPADGDFVSDNLYVGDACHLEGA